MTIRKVSLCNDQIYHIYSKSIAKYCIFRSENDFQRIKDTLRYYLNLETPCKYSSFNQLSDEFRQSVSLGTKKRTELIAYCIMPTHIHLVLKQLLDNGITDYMGTVLKSYSKYFNKKYERKGPLWENRFKNILIESDEQLLHLTRYLHLNPVSAGIADSPEQWEHSSYNEYCCKDTIRKEMCVYNSYINMSPAEYKAFVIERKDYQRELEIIKKHI